MRFLLITVLLALAYQSDQVSGRIIRKCLLESDVMWISCTDGETITIVDAFYGRSGYPPSYCPPMQKTGRGTCEDRHARLRVQDFCEGRSMCDIPVSSNTFGSPCPSQHPTYLTVEYECVSRRVKKVVRTCESDVNTADLQCPANTLVSIEGAFFGRLRTGFGTDAVCQNAQNADNVHCYDEDTSIRIREECEDRESCRILANSVFFPKDPCPGTSKYVFVIFSCTSPVCGRNQFFDPNLQICCHDRVFDRDPGHDTCCPDDFDPIFENNSLETLTRGCCPPRYTPYNSEASRCCKWGVTPRRGLPPPPGGWPGGRCID